MPNSKIESESEPAARKRISLACQRCRRRKIKCEPSGTIGDGQACSACKTSKSAECQFLRVNSGELFCPPESPNGPWILSSPERTTFAVVPLSNDLRQYSVSHPSQMAKTTSRSQQRTLPNISDQTSRIALLPPPNEAPRVYNPGPIQQAPTYDFDNILRHQTYQPLCNQDFSQDLALPWPEMMESNNASDPVSQRLFTDYSQMSFQEPTYASSGSPPGTLFPLLSPLGASLPLPDTTAGPRHLPHPAGYQSQTSTNSYVSPSGAGGFGASNSKFTPDTEHDGWGSTSFYGDKSSDSELNPYLSNDLGASPPSSGSSSSRRESVQHQTYADYSQAGIALPGPKSLPLPMVTEPEISQSLRPKAGLRLSSNDHYRSIVPATNSSSRSQEAYSGQSDGSSRGYRVLQPQPQRVSKGLPSINSSIDNRRSRSSRKSPSPRLSQRQHDRSLRR